MKSITEKISAYALEEIMEDRFARYSKYIIQERALPDIRDGLKPVQRRILYSMYKEKNTFDKGYKKSAKTVGDVIGKYHPHGDTSIYEAMVRMSQAWKLKNPLIDMHGNNGSIDGDSPAAYRYTEARLAKISNELLRDLDKDTVIFTSNFDDTSIEPTVLPSRFPNLLINGSSGISAGYATNIPPHNLGEIIEATIKRIDNPNCTCETILEIIKGPDFPTGGIVEGQAGLVAAYKKGKGRIFIKAKIEIKKSSSKNQLIITEIPYEVNKANLVRKINEIRIERKIEGITAVRDESDRAGLCIVVDLKKESDPNLIINYLLKNTDLYVSYNFNMVAIVKRRPKLLGILPILDAYIEHQKEVIIKRSAFDLKHARLRLHIVSGLIKALAILDEVIKTIRASKNKQDAQNNLIKQYDFTEVQAEAIVLLQLYKLTNTDVSLLEAELKDLELRIKVLQSILDDENILKKVVKHELRKIKNEYGQERLTVIKAEVTKIEVDPLATIPEEEVIVVVSKEGYVKRVSQRSYRACQGETTLLKDLDYVIGLYEISTLATLLLFTNQGNYLYVPVYIIPETKWKDLGKHISNIITLKPGEEIISSIPIISFNKDQIITIFTKKGMLKRTYLKEYEVARYSRPLRAIKLNSKDEVVAVTLNLDPEVLIVTKHGYGLWFSLKEITITGIRTSGVKAINLKEDIVISGLIFKEVDEYLLIITNKNTGKRLKLNTLTKTSRNCRGKLLVRKVKSNPYYIKGAFLVNNKVEIGLKGGTEINYIKPTVVQIMDLNSTGSTLGKGELINCFPLINKPLNQVESSRSLETIDQELATINDLLTDVDY